MSETRELTNDQFRDLWFLLDGHMKRVADDDQMGMSARTTLGVIEFAERVQKDLDAFKDQVVARAKAEFESVKRDEEMLRDHVGADRFASIETEYTYGLKFGDKNKPQNAKTPQP